MPAQFLLVSVTVSFVWPVGKIEVHFPGYSKIRERASPVQSIRPLCPTRWTVRTCAIHSRLDQYQPVLLALEEMASGKLDSATRANGLLERFQKGSVVLGLLLALEVTEELECLNKFLQSRSQTVNGMFASVTCVKDDIFHKRAREISTYLQQGITNV